MDAETAMVFMEKYALGGALSPEDADIAHMLERCGRIHIYRDRRSPIVSPTWLGGYELEAGKEGEAVFCDYCLCHFLADLEGSMRKGPRERLPDDVEAVEIVYPVRCDIVFNAAKDFLERNRGARSLMDSGNPDKMYVQFPNGDKVSIVRQESISFS